jgi:hypothetical protein
MKERNGKFFGLNVFYATYGSKAPTDIEVTIALAAKFRMKEFKQTHVRALKLGFGDTISMSKDSDGWKVEEVFQLTKKTA